jgi:hypothetical protein
LQMAPCQSSGRNSWELHKQGQVVVYSGLNQAFTSLFTRHTHLQSR